MTRHSSVPIRPKATAQKIVGAAEQMFRAKGYHKATVSTLAKQLEMSPANIYRFYHSKEDLRTAVFSRMLEGGYLLLRRNAHRPVAAPIRMKRLLLLQHAITVSLVSNNAMREFVLLSIARDRAIVNAHIARLRGLFAAVIADGIIGGDFAEQSDCGRAAMMVLMATVKVWHPEFQANQSRMERSERDLIRFVAGALRHGNLGA